MQTHTSTEKPSTTGKKILRAAGLILLGGIVLTATAIAIAKVVSEDDDPDTR